MLRCVIILGLCVGIGAGLAAGCGKRSSSQRSSKKSSQSAEQLTPVDVCVPSNLASATSVSVVLPDGCTFAPLGTIAAPRVVLTAQEVGQLLQCKGVAPPVFDFTTHDILLATYSLSPATVRTDVLDDGSTVSFVAQLRPPCPGEPPPMPVQATLAFRLPRGAKREFRESFCTLPEQCKQESRGPG